MKWIQRLIITKLLFWTSAIAAQENKTEVHDPKNSLPGIYDEKLNAFRSEATVPGQIVFLGNSITMGGDWKNLLKNSLVLNRGIGGDITYGVLQRLSEVTDRHPALLFILIGINDIGRDIPVVDILTNYRRIIEKVSQDSPETRIHVFSILPVNPTVPNFIKSYDKNDVVLEVNRQLQQMSKQYKIKYIDLHKILANKDGLLHSDLTKDGLHLNSEGYKIWAEYILKNQWVVPNF